MCITDGEWNNRTVQAWALRTKGDPTSYAGAVITAMANFDRAMLPIDVQTMDSMGSSDL
jgi:hypothetical protein